MQKIHQKGFFILIIVALIAILGIVGLLLSNIVTVNSRQENDRQMASQAFYIAQSGLENGIYALTSPNLTSTTSTDKRYSCAGFSLPNQNFAQGLYTVNSVGTTPYLPAAVKLKSAITATSTTIPVNSVVGFAPKGRIRIESENIDYSAIGTSSTTCGNGTPACFMNVTRGQDNSVATIHLSGTAIGQNQCDIQASAGIPDLGATTAHGRRYLQQSIQLQSGWIASDTNSNIALYSWNGFNGWNGQGTTSPNKNMNALVAISYVDVWSAGDGGQLNHYDGSTWTSFTTLGKGNLVGISCINSTDCWAVNNNGIFYHYNGNSWTTSTNVNKTIYSLFCSGSTCWATAGNGQIYTYNGADWVLSIDLGSSAINAGACADANHCWAAGASGKFYFYNGASWSLFSTVGNQQINSLTCLNANNCWAVGNNTTIYQYNGNTWSQVFNLNQKNLLGIDCYNAQDCWAVGQSGVIYHYDGNAWGLYTTITGGKNLNAIALVGPAQQPSAIWREVYN